MKRILIIYTVFLIQSLDIISAGFLECSADLDCIAANAKCVDRLCQCPQGQVFSSDGATCLPIAIGIKAPCTDDQQCAWLLGKHRCNNGACDCEEGWRYYQGRCLKFVGLSEPCNTDQDCFNGYDILAMSCQQGNCSCNTGYYLRGDYDCRPETTEIGDYCSLDLDCKIEGSTCIGSFCADSQSRKKFTNYLHHDENVSLSTTNSVSGYKTCNTDSDCAAVPNSICYPLTGTCICKRGYFLKSEADGCVGELGMDVGCTNDADCKITPGLCKSGICYCRKTYFSVATNNACQKPMTQDNLFCNNAERCYVLGTETMCQIQTHQCTCRSNAELDEDYICRSTGDPGIPQECDSNEELCNSIVNSICLDGRCECPDNFRKEKDVCLPNLGASCDDTTKPCQIENAFCNNKICECLSNYTENGATKCLKLVTALDSPCEINEQCSKALKYSECKEKRCACISGYIDRDGTCKAEKYMRDTCTNAMDCHVMMSNNVQCRNGICQCSADMVPTRDNRDCASGSKSMLVFNTGLMTSITIWLLCLHLLMHS